MEKNESWGKMFYYWGHEFHSNTDESHNATWGEENDVEKFFSLMKTKFIEKNIPVIIGEFSAMNRSLNNPSEESMHLASRQYYYKYIVKSALSKGIIPFCWDVNMGLFDRDKGKIIDRGVIDAIMQGTKEARVSNKLQ